MKHRSTHPSRYYERQAPTTMSWESPTWIERNGEFIAAMLGAVIIAGSLGAVVGILIGGALS